MTIPLDSTLTWGLALAVSGLSFLLSASAGLGGSLILVPALALLLGAKQGIALAALLLSWNNVAKVIAYRHTIPWRQSAVVLVVLAAGAAIGARLLVAADERLIHAAILGAFSATFLLERLETRWLPKLGAPVLAFTGGLTSGFAGTSGPMKGIALRSLALDRFHFLGAASLVSLVGDLTKLTVFVSSSLLGGPAWLLLAGALPMMVLATTMGFRINTRVSERTFRILFWSVIAGYSLRLVLRF
jgi:uncharacterized membrane protein YfcA